LRTIAVLNQKGGVGKTTTVVNAAAALAAAGRKVVVIDLDPQAHLTIHLGVESQAVGAGAYEVLTRSADFAGSLMLVRPNLWLLAANIDLVGAETELINVVGREIILREAMQPSQDQFDFCLIDCPPSLSVLSLNALAAAQEVLIPLQPHFLALQGFGKLLQTIDLVNKRINRHLKVSGVLLCMNDTRASLSNEVRADIEQFLTSARGANNAWSGAVILPTFIRRNIKLAEAPSYGQTIFEYAPDCNGAEDYRRVANFLLGITEPPQEPSPAVPPIEIQAVSAAPQEPPVAAEELDAPAGEPEPAPAAAAERPEDVSAAPDAPESTDRHDDEPPRENRSTPAPIEIRAIEPKRESASLAPDDISAAQVVAGAPPEEACATPDAVEGTDCPDGPMRREDPAAGVPEVTGLPDDPPVREDPAPAVPTENRVCEPQTQETPSAPAPICIRPIHLPVPQCYAPAPVWAGPRAASAEPMPAPGGDPVGESAPTQFLCVSRPRGDILPTRATCLRTLVSGRRTLRALGGIVKRSLALFFRPRRRAIPKVLGLEAVAR
jgi:chromosome partitioning protein